MSSNSVPCEEASLIAPAITSTIASGILTIVAAVLTTVAAVLTIVTTVVTAVLVVIATVLAVVSTGAIAITTHGKLDMQLVTRQKSPQRG